MSGGFLQINTGTGTDRRFPDAHRLFDESTAPGLASQPDFLRLRYDLVADYRDTPGNAHSGGIVAAAFSRLHDRGGGAYSFNSVEVEARHYIPCGPRCGCWHFGFTARPTNPTAVLWCRFTSSRRLAEATRSVGFASIGSAIGM